MRLEAHGVGELMLPHELLLFFLLLEKICDLFSLQFAEYLIKIACRYSIIGY